MLFPSTKPAWATPWRKALTKWVVSADDKLLRKPTTGILDCARDESGHAAAPPSSVINWRRLMSSIGPSFCRRSPLPATGRGGQSTAYLACHGARGQILGPSLNLSESRQIAASAAPVLPPKTIAQRYHGKLRSHVLVSRLNLVEAEHLVDRRLDPVRSAPGSSSPWARP